MQKTSESVPQIEMLERWTKRRRNGWHEHNLRYRIPGANNFTGIATRKSRNFWFCCVEKEDSSISITLFQARRFEISFRIGQRSQLFW